LDVIKEGYMSFKIVENKYGCVPTFFCDVCGAAVKNAQEAHYTWRVSELDKNDGVADLQITCGYKCRIKTQVQAPDGHDWHDIPLDVLPVYLMRSLGISLKDARRRANMFAGLHPDDEVDGEMTEE
jgi:hypothetical protein